MNGKIIEVTWFDACSEDATLHIQAVRDMKPLRRKNIGYEIDTTQSHVTISKGLIEDLYHNELGYDGALCIPKGMIIEVKEL